MKTLIILDRLVFACLKTMKKQRRLNTSLGGEARSQLSKSIDPSNIMSLISTSSTSSVSLTTEDSASNSTVVNIANMSKKRPLSSHDASSPRRSQCNKYWIYHAPLDETLGHQCVSDKTPANLSHYFTNKMNSFRSGPS